MSIGTQYQTRNGERSRQARGLRTDESILDSAISVIDAQGIERFSLRDVAAGAGVTHGALYARYENTRDMLADLWVRRLQDEFDRVVVDAEKCAIELPATDHLAKLFQSSPTRRVLAQAIAVAPRVDELHDVMPGRLGWRTTNSADVAHCAYLLLALAIGAFLQEKIDGKLSKQAPELADWLARAADLRVEVATQKPLRPPMRLQPVATADPLKSRQDRIFDATLRVIAKSGVAGTTLRRVSRASGYAHTAVYQEYATLDQLIAAVLAQHVSSIELSDLSAPHESVEVAVQIVHSYLSRADRMRERLLIEFAVAGVADPELGQLLKRADQRMFQSLASAIDGNPAVAERSRQFSYVHRDFLLGLSMLSDAVPDSANVEVLDTYSRLLTASHAAAQAKS